MKERICTAVSTVLLAAPWSIFILRQKTWALESPGAEIVIGCYAALMVLGCLFTLLAYAAGKVQNSWMKLCLVIHSVYAVVGAAAAVMMAAGKIF